MLFNDIFTLGGKYSVVVSWNEGTGQYTSLQGSRGVLMAKYLSFFLLTRKGKL